MGEVFTIVENVRPTGRYTLVDDYLHFYDSPSDGYSDYSGYSSDYSSYSYESGGYYTEGMTARRCSGESLGCDSGGDSGGCDSGCSRGRSRCAEGCGLCGRRSRGCLRRSASLVGESGDRLTRCLDCYSDEVSITLSFPLLPVSYPSSSHQFYAAHEGLIIPNP